MHPGKAFRLTGDERGRRAQMAAMLDETGFGMVFAATPDGPRVAHVPLLATGENTVQFHLARGNALAGHLEGATTLAVVNGPDGYVSPRWYADPAQVPTWNYAALELEGPVRRVDAAELVSMLAALSDRHEARLSQGTPWTMDKLPPDQLRAMLAGIIGYELEVRVWRETFKLSQNKPAAERARVAQGLEREQSAGIAALMRNLSP